MKGVKLILVGLAIAAILLGTKVLAAESTVTVDVSVQSVAQLSVIPTILSWTNINPGQAGTVQSLNIKNTGSVNLTNIYAYVDTLTDETTRPYGTQSSKLCSRWSNSF